MSNPPNHAPPTGGKAPSRSLIPITPGLQIGEYQLIEKLGEGGMGEVWRGVHPVIGKKVAVKLLSDRLVSNRKTLERFKREAKAVNEIHHRNVVDVFSFGDLPDGRPYLVMELLEGKSLGAYLKQRAPLPFGEIVALVGQLCRALQAAHDRGIIHRDLKPDNVFLILEEGSPPFLKLLDFGIAKLADNGGGPSLTRTGLPFGTPAYMSPEQCESAKEVDHRTDIYALGIILFEMIAGCTPFYAPGDGLASLMAKHKTQPPPAPSSKVTGREVPPAVDALVLRMLAKRADERPSRCLDVLQELNAALGEKRSEESSAIAGSKSIIDAPAAGLPSRPKTEPPKHQTPAEAVVQASVSPGPSQTGKYYTGTSKTVQPEAPRRSWPLYAMGGALLLAVGVIVGILVQPSAPAGGEGVSSGRVPLSAPGKLPEAPHTPQSKPSVPDVVPREATLSIVSSPSGAQVFLFGQPQEGTTPMQLKVRTGQPLDLRVELAGYEPQSRPVTLTGSELVQFALVPLSKGSEPGKKPKNGEPKTNEPSKPSKIEDGETFNPFGPK